MIHDQFYWILIFDLFLCSGKEALKLGTKVNESEPVEIELIEMQPIERKTNENDTVAAVDEPNVEVTNL